MTGFGSIEKTVGWGYVFSLLGILALALVAYNVSKGEIESADWVTHTQEVIASLEGIQRYALDAESTGRGFLVSGDPVLIERYMALLPAIDAKIRDFRTLTSDNLHQQQYADELLGKTRLRFSALTTRIARRRDGDFPAIRNATGLGSGVAEMDAIKALIGGMIDEENRLLKQRKSTRDASVHRLWGTIAIMVLLGGCVLTWIFRQTLIAVRLRQKAEDNANHLAHHDGLTGLPNRRMLQDRLAQALAAAHRHGHKLAVLFLDLDGFKKINDNFGHDIGDELLKEVARRLTATLRKEDTAVRLGGDEFVIGLMRIAQGADAESAAKKVIEALARPYHIHRHELTVTASVGISISPDNGSNGEELLKQADTALYKAKTGGKNRYCLS